MLERQIAKLMTENPVILPHSIRVFLLVSDVLDQIPGRFTHEEERSLLAAALFHDIGKGYWPGRWHKDPKYKLSQADITIMQMHPIQGANVLREAGISDLLVLQLVEQHHERPGGRGYPHQLENVHPLALVLAACDVYAACTEPRPYRSRNLTADEALQEVGRFIPETALKAFQA